MAADRPARIFFTSGSTSSPPSPDPFPPAPPPTPPAPVDPELDPFAPTLARERFSSDLDKCSLSFSARSRYSVNLFRMRALSLSFFSSAALSQREGRFRLLFVVGLKDGRKIRGKRSDQTSKQNQRRNEADPTHTSWPSRSNPKNSGNSCTPPVSPHRTTQLHHIP
jgi:hypothetical protein